MNRERAKELLPIIQAFADGEEIELKGDNGTWVVWETYSFSDGCDFRIKPKPREVYLEIAVKNRKVLGFKLPSEPMPQNPVSRYHLFREVTDG